jgi:hypothetical protein
VVLQSNGIMDYLITFKVGPLRAYTLSPLLPLLEAPTEDFFWNFPEFRRRIRSGMLHGCEPYPQEAYFQSREQPKVALSEMQRLRCVMTGTFFSERNCCATSSVHYCIAETTVPANCCAAFSELRHAIPTKLVRRNDQ